MNQSSGENEPRVWVCLRAWNGNVEYVWERLEERDKAERDLLEKTEDTRRMKTRRYYWVLQKVDASRSSQKVNRSLDAC